MERSDGVVAIISLFLEVYTFTYHLPFWYSSSQEENSVTSQFFILSSSFFISGLRPDKLSFLFRLLNSPINAQLHQGPEGNVEHKEPGDVGNGCQQQVEDDEK